MSYVIISKCVENQQLLKARFQKLISVPTCHCPIHLPQETSLFYIWCIFSLSALHSSLNKMFCWLERKLFDPFNGHLSSDKLHLHSVKSLKFPFFSPVANWRRSPLITSFLTGHVTRSSQELNVSSGFFMAPWKAWGVRLSQKFFQAQILKLIRTV